MRVVSLMLLLMFACASSPAEPAGQRRGVPGGDAGQSEPANNGLARDDRSDFSRFLYEEEHDPRPVRTDQPVGIWTEGRPPHTGGRPSSPLFVLTKKRDHYVTVGFELEDGQQQALLFRVDKDDVRPLLVSLEARSGRKVSYQDDEARKAGK